MLVYRNINAISEREGEKDRTCFHIKAKNDDYSYFQYIFTRLDSDRNSDKRSVNIPQQHIAFHSRRLDHFDRYHTWKRTVRFSVPDLWLRSYSQQ